ncbi:MAG: YraN family protein [Chloroflexi bacterium]|nr:MAG: YraN family protein [Chloroflexota bacterium]
MTSHLTPRELGTHGERLAEEHLVGLGYRILDRNWRWQKGELDLVAEQGDEVVFVEVKTRRSQTYGPPEESITRAKRDKLIQTAYAYLGSANRQDVHWRIDVVAIDMERDGTVIRLEHIVSAVEGD